MSRSIICRFNKSGLQQFNTYHNLALLNKTTEVDLDSGKIKVKEKHTVNKPTKIPMWKSYWNNMPQFNKKKVVPYAKVIFTTSKLNSSQLSEYFNQHITDKTKSIWFPALEKHTKRYYRVVGGVNPDYPIYVVSYHRCSIKKCLTVKWLNLMEVPHYLVVEPNEYESYKQEFSDCSYTTVLQFDMKYKDTYDTLDNLGNTKGKGPGGARNFCKYDSIARGFNYHWVMDDNIDGFHYLTDDKKFKVRTGAIFKASEDFFTRFSNAYVCGLNYSKFCKECDNVPAFITNTRIYSCLFINNKIEYDWRGRYNEDTILSLDVLTHGYCTIQLNAFLCDKITTQRIKGGNNDMFYADEGTYNKSKMLVDVYPKYAKMVHKFNRCHHHVDYSSFTQNLAYDTSYIPSDNKVNDFGMKIVTIPSDWEYTNKDTKGYIEQHLSECIPYTIGGANE